MKNLIFFFSLVIRILLTSIN